MRKLKVCIVAVCYNAHGDASKFLSSVAAAFNRYPSISLSVVLVDNSNYEAPNNVKYFSSDFQYHYLNYLNIGYFPAFYSSVCELDFDLESYDYTIVSNVDLFLSEIFFEELSSINHDSTMGLLAPSIISINDGRDLNPKMIKKPSKIKIQIMKFVCTYPLIFSVYQRLQRLKDLHLPKRKVNGKTYVSGQVMYGAHGAFMIFTKNYFKSGASIDYPRFLFGEEGFVAEEVASHGLKIVYNPSLVIYDKEHGSTSLQATKFICGEHRKSYDFYLSNYL